MLRIVVFLWILMVANFTLAQDIDCGTKTVTGKVKIMWENNQPLWAEFNICLRNDGQIINNMCHLWSDNDSRKIDIAVTNVKIDGNFAWFSGKCISDNFGKMENQWLFVSVSDMGVPGSVADNIWCEWLGKTTSAAAAATKKVSLLQRPYFHKEIKSGDIKVEL
jgi:hypothetical protein